MVLNLQIEDHILISFIWSKLYAWSSIYRWRIISLYLLSDQNCTHTLQFTDRGSYPYIFYLIKTVDDIFVLQICFILTIFLQCLCTINPTVTFIENPYLKIIKTGIFHSFLITQSIYSKYSEGFSNIMPSSRMPSSQIS